MLVFNAKSVDGPSKITKMYVQVNATDTPGIPDTLYLMDGTTVVGTSDSSALVSGNQAVFTGLDISVAQDTTKTLTVQADFPSTALSQAASTTIPASGVRWEKPDGSTASTTPTAAVSGNDQYLYKAAPQFTLLSSTATSETDTASAPATTTLSFSMTIKATAVGGSMVKPAVGDFTLYFASTSAATYTQSDLVAGQNAILAGSNIYASTTVSISGINPNNVDPVSEDGSYTFTLSGTLKQRKESGLNAVKSGDYRMILTNASSTVGGNPILLQTWGLSGFETGVRSMPN